MEAVLSAADQARVAAAIQDAEGGTAGEIAVVLARQASGYHAVPVVWGLLAALLAPAPLIWLTALSASRIHLLQLGLAMAFVGALAWLGRRPALAPRFLKRRRAREAAQREFLGRGLTRTRSRTGILIYVALAERHAEVIADDGIAARVDEQAWRETVTALVAALAEGRIADGLVAAVEQVGAILSRHAPPEPDDVDELPNRLYLT